MEIGQEALIWLAGQPGALTQFLAVSGAEAAALRTRVDDPEFLGFVLEFLLTRDEMVVDFARAGAMTPETAVRARAALPGGDAPHWT